MYYEDIKLPELSDKQIKYDTHNSYLNMFK